MTSDRPQLDGEINYRVLTRLTIGLLALVAVAMVLMWYLSSTLFQQEKAQDPPPPLMVEAREPHLPPSPRLQSEPFADFELLRARHEARLGSYGWENEAAGLAHIPIDKAMDLLVEEGLEIATVPQESAQEQPGD